MTRNLKKGLLCLVVGFIVMFLARLAYGYLSPREQAVLSSRSALSDALITTIGGRDGSLKNYASEKLKVQRGDVAQVFSVDQKYEKVASVESKTTAFENDEKTVRDLTTKYSALIQLEKSSGLPGHRSVAFAIGVPPDRFDPMVADVKTIGELASIRIDKTDKTNEYKELKAKRASLEKTRDALMSLKSKAGGIDEFTNLENRILQIDEQIQSTGVELGEFDQENEFCTVQLSLEEKSAAVAGISFRHRVVVALAWAVKYYALLLALLCLGMLLTLLAVVVLQRLNVIPPPERALAAAGD